MAKFGPDTPMPMPKMMPGDNTSKLMAYSQPVANGDVENKGRRSTESAPKASQ